MTKTPVAHDQETVTVANETKTGKKGFASMDIEKKRAIASAGGKAAHKKGSAYKFDSAKAIEAGRKGGQSISRNREHMAAIGKKGGEARSRNAGQNRYDTMLAQESKPV